MKFNTAADIDFKLDKYSHRNMFSFSALLDILLVSLSMTENAETTPEEVPELSELLQNEAEVTFKSLGLKDVLCQTLETLGWKKPSKIQQESIPQALLGNDIIGVAETGSGKTGAFVLPILQDLLINPGRLHALVLAPTRELAV